MIGSNSSEFKSHLGIVVKNGLKVPLTYAEWTHMPDDVLEFIWKEVKENTDAPDAYKPYCLKNAGKPWKDWKYRVKSEHYNGKTDAERLASIPPRVVEEQWKTLVAYWGTKESKAAAEKNKMNRSQVYSLPRTGRTSFAIKKEQMKKQGKKTYRISVFIETRSKRNSSISDVESEEIISQFHEHLSHLPEEQQTEAVRDRVFTQVMGPDGHGYARTYEHGPTPSDVMRTKSNEANEILQQEINRLKSNYADLQCKYSDLQTKYAEIHSFMRSHFDDFAAEIQSSTNERIPDASSSHHNNQNANPNFESNN